MSRSISKEVLSYVLIASGGYFLISPIQTVAMAFFVDIRTQIILGLVLLGFGIFLQLKG